MEIPGNSDLSFTGSLEELNSKKVKSVVEAIYLFYPVYTRFNSVLNNVSAINKIVWYVSS